MPTLMILVLGSLVLAPVAAMLALACAAAAGRGDRWVDRRSSPVGAPRHARR
jgi:hypothetical protein